MTQLLKDSDVARLLAVSRRQVWKLRAADKLPPEVRIGGSVRWRASDIDRWIQTGCPARAEWDERATVGGAQ